MEFKLEEQTRGARNGRPTAASSGSGSEVRVQERAWLTKIREELDDYYGSMEKFFENDPADNMAQISSIGARLSHIRALLQRSGSQPATSLRTKEVDPLIEALEFQFKIHSRVVSLAELEYKMAGGAN